MKPVTVGDLVKIGAFNEKMTLVTKNKCSLKNTINYVTIMEAPDFFEWVTGGEFVLTTWYSFSLNPELQVEAFSKLADKISAIAIKTGRFIDEIPPEIIEIAEERKIAVFEVVTKEKFREIVQIISSELQNYQTNVLVEAEKYYQKLIKTSINFNNINDLLGVLYAHIGRNCFCLNNKQELMGYKIKKECSKNKLYQWIEVFKQYCVEDIEIGSAYNRVDNLNIFVCQGRQDVLGFLIIAFEEEISDSIKLMAQQTSSFLSMQLIENYEDRQKNLNTFWGNFVQGYYQNRVNELRSVLQKINMLSNCGYTLIVMDDVVEAYQISNIIEHYTGNIVVFNLVEFVVVLITDKKYANKNYEWAERIIKHLNKQKQRMLIVIAPPVNSLDDLFDIYTLNINAYKFLKEYGFSGIVESKKYIFPNILFKNMNTAEYKYLQQEITQPILNYDARYKSDLLKTLSYALRYNSLERTARKMHIHINTLRYRLSKISELTGKTFFDIRDRYTLMSACMLEIDNLLREEE